MKEFAKKKYSIISINQKGYDYYLKLKMNKFLLNTKYKALLINPSGFILSSFRLLLF